MFCGSWESLAAEATSRSEVARVCVATRTGDRTGACALARHQAQRHLWPSSDAYASSRPPAPVVASLSRMPPAGDTKPQSGAVLRSAWLYWRCWSQPISCYDTNWPSVVLQAHYNPRESRTVLAYSPRKISRRVGPTQCPYRLVGPNPHFAFPAESDLRRLD